MRRLDLGRKGRVVAHDAVDDPADRLVYERDPELVEIGHDRIMPTLGSSVGPRERPF
jgi:hypothetical protein